MRRQLLAGVLAAVAAIVIAQPGSTARGREGGILKISFSGSAAGLDSVDPALAFLPANWSLLEATCARLYSYPDTASPQSYRLQPEVAASSSHSKDFKAYTFTLRRGFRFSNGDPVRASAFARAIDRALNPLVHSPGAIFMRDIVGADEVLSGRAETVRGVVARGNTLVVRFKRPAPNFVARTAHPVFCAVPPWLPPLAEGPGPFHSAGPYYVAEYLANERIEIRRNRFYGGERKVHLEGFNVNLRGGTPVELLQRVDRGEFDWGYMFGGVFATPGLDFEAKYGVCKTRFCVRPGLTLRLLAFNTSRPLFRKNPRLRQAVNFALDRRAHVATSYGRVLSRATDRLIPPGVPGFRDADVYPLRGNIERARELAHGQLRHAKAVLSVSELPAVIETAQLVKDQLAKIGLEVEIQKHPGGDFGAELLANLTRPGAEWDIAFLIWAPFIRDAHEHLSLLLETRLQGGETLTRVRSKGASAALARAARLPRGRARNLAYAEADAMIARDVAPVAVLSVLNEATIVTERVDCKVFRPALDLGVACLKE